TGQPSTHLENEAGGSEFFLKFVEDLFVLNYPAARALADAMAGPLGAAGATKVLDIAAGAGVWGIALAEKLPSVQVTAVDWASVTELAKRVAKRHHVGERYRTIA